MGSSFQGKDAGKDGKNLKLVERQMPDRMITGSGGHQRSQGAR